MTLALDRSAFLKRVRQAKTRELMALLRRDYPALVREPERCEHVERMLEDIGCAKEERRLYEPLCWECEMRLKEKS